MATKVVVTERSKQYTERLQQLLETGDIFHPVDSGAVTLKESGWVLCWVNTSISPRQLQDMLNLGLIYVEPTDIEGDVRDFGAQVSPENRVTIGLRGEEVLMKCPDWYWRERQLKKAQKNVELTYGEKAKRDLVNAVGSELGDQAANFATRMTIKDSRRPYELPDE